MNILEVYMLKKCFYSGESCHEIRAVDGISFSVEDGEFLGLVGESGCGKSTTAKILAGLIKADSGTLMLEGQQHLTAPYKKEIYKKMQMIFQNPQDSFDPRKTIGSSIIDIQRNFGINKTDAANNAIKLLGRVGLKAELATRFPHQISGGECQRAAIARAISISPKLIICDEVTSALDVSVQAQIVELLQDLQQEMGLSLLFISHDLALVQGICKRVLVMYNGKIVEEGPVQEVLTQPKNPYTQFLLSSVFTVPSECLSACF